MTHPLRVNQPCTEMVIDGDGVLITQGDRGDESFVTIDPVFIPILIKWLREAEKYLREKRNNGE